MGVPLPFLCYFSQPGLGAHMRAPHPWSTFFQPGLGTHAGSHIQTLMGSQSLQHRSREQQPYEGNINKVTIQQFQSPLPIQIPSSQASRGPQPGRCLIQTKGQRSMDGYPEQ
ncbi:hypothetical protein U0070_024598, partial [Myodes glareolus]